MAKHDVIAIGAATVDAFVWSKAFRKIRSKSFGTGVGECFSLGSKIEMDNFVLGTGGGATNAAATFANLGLKPACITAVGDDLFGSGVIEDLKRHKVSTEFVRTVHGGQTAFSTILVIPSGERTVLVSRGVSERLSAEAIPWEKVKADWIYMTSLGGNLKLAERVADHAWRNGIDLFWNPGSKDMAHGIQAMRPIASRTTVLDMNREEAMRLTKRELHDLPSMIADLERIGPSIVLLTDGEKGAYLAEGGKLWHVAADRKLKVVNRTGAGDAFGSGFVAGLLRYGDRTRALQLAVRNSEGVIQAIGAKTGLLKSYPSLADLKRVSVKAV